MLKIDLEKIGQAKNIFDEPKSNAKNTIYMFHEQRHKKFSEAVFDSISQRGGQIFRKQLDNIGWGYRSRMGWISFCTWWKLSANFANRWRINFQTDSFYFYTDSLAYASPAAVSRVGTTYLNNEDTNVGGCFLSETAMVTKYLTVLI